jgi:hypothetical protein
MDKKKLPVISIVFYILAALSLAYAIWGITYSSKIVSEAIAMGQLVVEGSEFEVISYYVSNTGLFILLAAVLVGLGWILQILSTPEVVYFEDELDEETPIEESLEELLEEVEEAIEEEASEE